MWFPHYDVLAHFRHVVLCEMFSTIHIVTDGYVEKNQQLEPHTHSTLPRVGVTTDGVLDWIIGFIDILYTPLGTTGN
jgi:hypothetical protein